MVRLVIQFIVLLHVNWLGSVGCVAYDIDFQQQSKQFDGIGAISGGGAVSRFLQNYKAKSVDQIMDLLFKPDFGLSLHMLKVEIGSDSQSTEGSESTHWRHRREEPNFNRGYEWLMLTEAKKRNPNILTYALPWGFPGWLGENTATKIFYPYDNVNDTAEYVVSFLRGARDSYNITFDYVGIWNEKPHHADYMKALHRIKNENGFTNTKIVANDNRWEIVDLLNEDEEIRQIVDVVGEHYPGTLSPAKAKNYTRDTGVPLWSVEDDSTTVSRLMKTGCIAKILNQNFVKGDFTNTIIWNIISSFYPALDYPLGGLLMAQEPWSGNFEFDSVLFVIAHTTQFTRVGWRYLSVESGGSGLLRGGGSWVTLVDPNTKHFSIIIEAMTYENSQCVRPPVNPFRVSASQVVTFHLQNFNAQPQQEVFVRYTKITNPSHWFESRSLLVAADLSITVTIAPDEIISISDVFKGNKPRFLDTPCSAPFPMPYRDDFESTPIDQEGRYMIQQSGAFEVVAPLDDEAGNHVLQQQALTAPITWCPVPLPRPYTILGDHSLSDVSLIVDIRLPLLNASEGIIVGTRVEGGGCVRGVSPPGVWFHWEDEVAMLTPFLTSVLPFNNCMRSQKLVAGVWHRLRLRTYGEIADVTLGNRTLIENCDISSMRRKNGFVALAARNYGHVQFDNISIEKISKSEIISPHFV